LLYQAKIPSLLLHSRFRPFERESQVARLINFQGIAIATQVVEAGIDLDARVLFTELAPWASMVQRFGRCGRRGTYSDAFVYWIAANSCCSIEDLMPYV
jgi:CRISPR-associated endonuclease/helicase Cas3